MSKVLCVAIWLLVVTTISYGLVSLAYLKFNAALLVIPQAVICYFLVVVIERFRPRFLVGMVVSMVLGWVVSFVISVLLESIFFDKFFLSIRGQYYYGSLAENLVAWFGMSFLYAGPVQAVGTLILFRYMSIHLCR